MVPASPFTALAESRSSTEPASRPCTRNFDMKLMSITMTPSRQARCSACQCAPERGSPPREGTGIGDGTGSGVPVGALPTADVLEVRTVLGQPVVERRPLRVTGGHQSAVRVVALVHHAQRLHRAGAAVLGVGLVRLQAGRVHAGDVDVGAPVRRSSAPPAGPGRRR